MPLHLTQTWKRNKKRCYYCGIRLTPGTATTDHVIARINGGSNNQAQNRVLACSPCNRMKGSLSVQEFQVHPWLIDRRTRVANGEIGAAPVVQRPKRQR